MLDRIARVADRVTGRWAISWQVLVFANALTYPQMVLTGGTLGSRQMPPEDIPTAAVVMGVAVLANAAYGVLAMFTVFRNRATRRVPLWLYAGFYLSAGVIPVLGMEYLDSILGKQTALPVGLRLFFACVTTLWLGVVFSLLLEGRDRFIRERHRLIDEAIALQRATIEEGQAGREVRASVDSLVDDRLAGARIELDRVLTSVSPGVGVGAGMSGDLQPAVSLLEETARDSVRPLSHELWDVVNREYPRPRAGQVFRHLWSDPRFMPGNTALITVIGLPGASVRGFGAWAPLAVMVIGLILWAWLALANRVISTARSVFTKRGLYVVAVLGALIAILAYSLIPGDVTTPAQDAGSIVIAFIAGVILVSYVSALNDVRRWVLASLEDEVSQQHIEAEARRSAFAAITREVAQSLHGSVQTRLIACAAAIDQAQRAGDAQATVRALEEGTQILDQWAISGGVESDETLESSVGRLVENWQALTDVGLSIDSQLASRRDLSHVAAIVEEGLSNAYRHGLAQRIEVSIGTDPSGIRIVIRDNGTGPSGNPPGLGRRLIAEYCDDRCSLERAGEWTVLSALALSTLN